MTVATFRPKSTTLGELLSHDFYKTLVDSIESTLKEVRDFKNPKEVVESKFGKEIVEIYKKLFLGSFCKVDMASLEHSEYLNHLLPSLSMDSFPLIANLDKKSQEIYIKVRFSTVMTCIWSFVEIHSSGRSEYVDVLSDLSSKYKDSFESLFFNAAQLLMVESWREDLCESREPDNFDRVTLLEQRALLRFFIVCFQRIELSDVRRCCMALLSPHVWMHIPEDLREANFFRNNKVSKALFRRSMENYKSKHSSCKFGSLFEELKKFKSNQSKVLNSESKDSTLSKELDSGDLTVLELYELNPNDQNLENLNMSYKLILSRDFMNSLLNQFVYILEDHFSLSNLEGEKVKDSEFDSKEEDLEMMRLMYIENYLELFIDLLSQLHLRRIIKPLIDHKLILVRCKNHPLYEFGTEESAPKGGKLFTKDLKATKEDLSVFVELVNILEYYLNFNINEELGVSVDFSVLLEEYYRRFNRFQRVCYVNYKDDENLKNIHLINNYSLNANLGNILSGLGLNVLVRLNQLLHLIPSGTVDGDSINKNYEDYKIPKSVELVPKKKKSKKLVKKLLVSNIMHYLRRPVSEFDLVKNNKFYLNPSMKTTSSSLILREVLVDGLNLDFGGGSRGLSPLGYESNRETEMVFETVQETKLSTMSLFKLNLQYLTLFDYLYRNYILYQFEVVFQIQQYIQQQLFILSYICHNRASTGRFGGGALTGYDSLNSHSSNKNRQEFRDERDKWVGRMFIGIDNIVIKVREKRVEMVVTVNLAQIQDYKIRQEWQQLTKYDILYLVHLSSTPLYYSKPNEDNFDETQSNNKEYDNLVRTESVKKIRFGELIEVYDEEDNNVLEHNPLDKKTFVGFKMRLKMLIEYDQYMRDIEQEVEYYEGFNLIVRRSRRQNNFKSILTNVQRVIYNPINVPNWLQTILLGYLSSKGGSNTSSSLPSSSHNSQNNSTLKNSEITKEVEGVNGSAKRRKGELTFKNLGIDFLNTFKSKFHLLNTTQFISVKLIPIMPNEVSLQSCYELLTRRGNRVYVNYLSDELNEFVNSNEKFDVNQFGLKLKELMENDPNVVSFIRQYLSFEGSFNDEFGSLTSKNDSELTSKGNEGQLAGPKEKLERDMEMSLVTILGVKFELYVELNYLQEVRQLSGSNVNKLCQKPRFLLTNFSTPFELSGSVYKKLRDFDNELENLNQNKENSDKEFKGIKFVNKQIEAIMSGSLEGLTVVMGPPGTGKTDVVSQIISILFNNFDEKIVICTHSNFALNDIFTKLVRNKLIDEHYMVRLGHSDLEVDDMGHFSKFGRVNYILQRRLDLLEVVKALKESLGVVGDYECTLQYSVSFMDYFLLSNRDFCGDGLSTKEEVEETGIWKGLSDFFNLNLKFTNTLKDLESLYSKVNSIRDTLDFDNSNSVQQSCEVRESLKENQKKFIHKLRKCLHELLPFEVFRNNKDRMKYLVENYAKIVAMTCTHASIAHEELETLNYKSLIFEEAAQILEIESFIPISHQIKRLVLVGDHLQLSPIIQNSSLQSHSNLNQSLFLRLIRLNYPYVQLNVQARSHQEILNVYKDFYPHKIYTLNSQEIESEVSSDFDKEDKDASPKNQVWKFDELLNQHRNLVKTLNFNLKYVVQFLNVKGEESSPMRYFYQNLEEAKFCVSLYMLMRLIGLEDIVILTAYNGQKFLIEDIVKKKCSWNNKIGSPIVSTIDKFQGRQADYVIVSLVRTKNVGYLKDPRRFVVATSRSKKGLYVVGNKVPIQNIKELSIFNKTLNKYPNYLRLTVKGSDTDGMMSKEVGIGGEDVEIKNNEELENLIQILM